MARFDAPSLPFGERVLDFTAQIRLPGGGAGQADEDPNRSLFTPSLLSRGRGRE